MSTFACVAVLPAVAGVSAPPTAINGQVFIVTRGGESVKLGLVTVRAIPESAVRAYLRGKADRAARERIGLALEMTGAQDDLKRAEERVRVEPKSSTLSFPTDAEEAVDDTRALLLKYAQRYSYLDSAAFYFDSLPPSTAVAKTDADGRFVLRLPRGSRVVLAAVSQREIAGTFERYYWLCLLPGVVQRAPSLLLSNDNLTSSDSPLSLLKTRH